MLQKVKRHRGRNSRLGMSVLTAILAKFFSIASSLLTIPLTLSYLGESQFGVWMAISSTVGLLRFADLGIGFGLQNELSFAYGRNDRDSSVYQISNSFLLATFISALLILITLLFFDYFSPNAIFKDLKSSEVKDSIEILKYCALLFFFSMPVTLVQRVLYGIQKTYLANTILLVGSILGMFLVIVSVYLDLGLMALSLLFMSAPTLVLGGYGIYFFINNPVYRPSIRAIEFSSWKDILTTGGWALLTQIVYSIKINSPVIIISTSLGAIAVAEYSVAQKLTLAATTFFSVALQPIWTVYGESYSKGDAEWITKAIRKSIYLSLSFSIFATIFFLFAGPFLVKLWLGSQISPSITIIGTLSVLMGVSNLNNCFAMFLNGTNNFKNQTIFCGITTMSLLVMGYFYTKDFGVPGLVILMTISELACLPFYFLESKRIIKAIGSNV